MEVLEALAAAVGAGQADPASLARVHRSRAHGALHHPAAIRPACTAGGA